VIFFQFALIIPLARIPPIRSTLLLVALAADLLLADTFNTYAAS